MHESILITLTFYVIMVDSIVLLLAMIVIAVTHVAR
jgi:hypothetical protein